MSDALDFQNILTQVGELFQLLFPFQSQIHCCQFCNRAPLNSNYIDNNKVNTTIPSVVQVQALSNPKLGPSFVQVHPWFKSTLYWCTRCEPDCLSISIWAYLCCNGRYSIRLCTTDSYVTVTASRSLKTEDSSDTTPNLFFRLRPTFSQVTSRQHQFSGIWTECQFRRMKANT